MSAPARESALAYLEGHNVMTLSTCGPEGPLAAAVFYASDGFTLYFLSSPATRHGRNLAADPRVAAAIHEDYRDWREIKGIQLEGRAFVLDGDEREAAARRYARKFPLIADPKEHEIQRALSGIAWHRLVSERLYFIDNALGFGHRERVL